MGVTMQNWQIVNTTGTAGAAFASRTATTTKPVSTTGIAVIDLAALFGREEVSNFVELQPIVGDADTETAHFRVWAWNQISVSGTATWVPRLLVHFVATATTASAAAVDGATTPKFCDTIAVSYGDDGAQVISPTNDVLASIIIHARGAELLSFEWSSAAGSGANANLLWRMVSQG
jgi:hypothetical protein